MRMLEFGSGKVMIGTATSDMVGTVSPSLDGYWISIGHPNENGILIDTDNWPSFVELVHEIDMYLKEYHE